MKHKLRMIWRILRDIEFDPFLPYGEKRWYL